MQIFNLGDQPPDTAPPPATAPLIPTLPLDRLANYLNLTITEPVAEFNSTPLKNFAKLVVDNRDFAGYMNEHDALDELLAPKVLYQFFQINERGATGAVLHLSQYEVYTSTADALSTRYPSRLYDATHARYIVNYSVYTYM